MKEKFILGAQNIPKLEKESPPFFPQKEPTGSEIKAFREDPLIQSFYQFIQTYDLRHKVLRSIERHLKSKEEVATYKDLE